MIRTTAMIEEAHQRAPRDRFALRGLMKVAERPASPEDMALVAKIRAATSPADFDKLIATKSFNSLYLRGVIYFGEQHG